jgi:hypothetical protein
VCRRSVSHHTSDITGTRTERHRPTTGVSNFTGNPVCLSCSRRRCVSPVATERRLIPRGSMHGAVRSVSPETRCLTDGDPTRPNNRDVPRLLGALPSSPSRFHRKGGVRVAATRPDGPVVEDASSAARFPTRGVSTHSERLHATRTGTYPHRGSVHRKRGVPLGNHCSRSWGAHGSGSVGLSIRHSTSDTVEESDRTSS